MKSTTKHINDIEHHDATAKIVNTGDHADCVFCKIVAKEIPCYQVYEDSETLVFVDLQPSTKGHVLVIPKDHVENIYGLSDEAACRLMMTVKKVAIAVKNGTDAEGVNLIMNNEEAAGQMIFHAHIHIIPRHNDDGLKPWPKIAYEGGEIEIFRDKIRGEIVG
jgi:histidine triad (HIT) family protein